MFFLLSNLAGRVKFIGKFKPINYSIITEKLKQKPRKFLSLRGFFCLL